MDIVKTIQQRKSTRTYTTESIKPSDKEQLVEFINAHKTGLPGESVDFVLIEKSESEVPMKLPYGLIRNNKSYIFGATGATALARVNYGYMLEQIVLKATELNMGTCWVGMFDRDYFSDIQVENGLVIPAILVIGYAHDKIPMKEKLIRKTVNADKRKPWETLFFDYELGTPLKPDQIKSYVEVLEMTRLAPSSGNTQPWRIFYNSVHNEFHFFKKITNPAYEAKGMHDIDLGIAMSHFELVANKNGLKGSWENYNPDKIKIPDNLHYMSSWKCK